jgi:PTH2 family peptidyl-tRNA hydrolase
MEELGVEYKQVIVVRKDVIMGKGKLAAQVAHAAVLGVEKTRQIKQDWLNTWFQTGQAKVILRVDNLKELFEIEQRARTLHLAVVSVQDSGLTQIPSGTVTCIGIGPGPAVLIDKITSHLKLL